MCSKTNKEATNLLEFSFCDHKHLFETYLMSADQRELIVENKADFWKFVNKYESMLKSAGQVILSAPLNLADEETMDLKSHHKAKFIALRLQLKDRHGNEPQYESSRDGIVTPLRIKQFQEILLTYLDFKQKEKFAKIKKLRKIQKSLPIYRFKQQLQQELNSCRVVIIAGDTGCGKSTQVPQYLYEFGYRSIGKCFQIFIYIKYLIIYICSLHSTTSFGLCFSVQTCGS